MCACWEREGRSEAWGLGMGKNADGRVLSPEYTHTYKKYSAEGALGKRVPVLSEITVSLGLWGGEMTKAERCQPTEKYSTEIHCLEYYWDNIE